MKAVFSLLALVATMNLARAGSFAGPPPFTNGSPLQTGTDGTYQAVVSGTNIAGVFSFVISGGIQTSDSNTIINSWAFFVDGNIFQGSVVAAISQSQVVGILNGGGAPNLSTGTNGTLSLPTAFIVSGNAASGEFSGCISLNSPIGAFSGEGTLQGTPERTDQLIFISEPSPAVIDANGNIILDPTPPVSVNPIDIPPGDFPETRFKFHGTRLSTTPATVSSAATPAASPSSG